MFVKMELKDGSIKYVEVENVEEYDIRYKDNDLIENASIVENGVNDLEMRVFNLEKTMKNKRLMLVGMDLDSIETIKEKEKAQDKMADQIIEKLGTDFTVLVFDKRHEIKIMDEW